MPGRGGTGGGGVLPSSSLSLSPHQFEGPGKTLPNARPWPRGRRLVEPQLVVPGRSASGDSTGRASAGRGGGHVFVQDCAARPATDSSDPLTSLRFGDRSPWRKQQKLLVRTDHCVCLHSSGLPPTPQVDFGPMGGGPAADRSSVHRAGRRHPSRAAWGPGGGVMRPSAPRPLGAPRARL